MYQILLIILFLILIYNTYEQCPDNQIQRSDSNCISIDDLLGKSQIEISASDINYLTGTIKSITKNGYDIDFMKINNKNIHIRHSIKSKIYISKQCIESIEQKLNIINDIGMVMIYTNSKYINENGLPEKNFIIRYPGSGINKYINGSVFDLSFCHEDPIILNNSININDIKVYKKKEKKNGNEEDTYELKNVDIDRVLYAKKKKVDLFDIHSDFLEDICFKFKSENDTDVTLETRTNDYYQNITLCSSKLNAHYMGFNYTKTDGILYYACAYGFYSSESDKKSYVDKINDKMNIVFTNSNFKVITCYKELLQFEKMFTNYGELMCVFVFFMQLIFFLTYCCKGTAPLQKQVDQLLASANKVSVIPPELQNNINPNTQRTKLMKNENVPLDNNQVNINGSPTIISSNNNFINPQLNNNNIQIINNINNNNNNNGQLGDRNIEKNNSLISSNEMSSNVDAESKNEMIVDKNSENINNNINNNIINNNIIGMNNININNNNNNLLQKGKKKKKKKRKSVQNLQNPPNRKAKRQSAIFGRTNDLIMQNIDQNNIIPEEGNNNNIKKKKKRKSVNIIRNIGLIKNDQDKIQLPNDKNDKKNDKELKKKLEEEKEAKAEQEDQIKKEKILQKRRSSTIFAFDNDDLNELDFDEARIFDKRNFCKYYCFMIQISNIIINTFCRCADYNLFIIKFGLLLFLFPINLTFNAFFFTSAQIQSVYVNKLSDISIDWKNLVRSFASSIISSIILIFLKILCLTHSSIRKLKKESNVEEAKRKSISTLKCIKIRICAYFIFSFIFLLIFGYYVSCFCAIFENTQIVLMESMATSWFLSLLYPFAICFVTSIFRRGALVCGKRGVGCCYKINKILQLI